MNWYCDYADDRPLHDVYHQTEYGFPKTDERDLFEIFALEIFQPGPSWDLILKKRATTFEAFEGSDVDRVAAYGERDKARLLSNPGIIRNKLKVEAIIHNARVIVDMRTDHGGFANWLKTHHPRNRRAWVKLFKKTFKFTGPEVTNEFLMCIGYLPGAHRDDCHVQKNRQGETALDAGRSGHLRNRPVRKHLIVQCSHKGKGVPDSNACQFF